MFRVHFQPAPSPQPFQVLAFLGDVAGARVVELGAGIGRFTRQLADAAAAVIAVDFMQNLIDQNQKANGDCSNVEFRCGDATEMTLPPASVDVLFSNWLLMYLGDAEVAQLATDALTWVAPGGTIFFRESCFRQSGDAPRASNPTHYRDPRAYFDAFDGAEVALEDGSHAHWELVACRCVEAYVRLKANQNQLCWKWRKVVTLGRRDPACPRAFLDGRQYTTTGILRYERVCGRGFVSSGGAAVVADLAPRLALTPACRVLDVGCGTGGGAMWLASHTGASVHGLDVSVNMVLLAMARAADAGAATVSFEVADAATVPLPDAAYDAVIARDALLHVKDKGALLRKLARALKPGGRLVVTDVCRGDASSPPTTAFAAYIDARGYDLRTVAEYGRLLEGAGFGRVEGEDASARYAAALTDELARLRADKAAFVAEFSEADYDAVAGGWEDKLARVGAGEQRWGVFCAVKGGEEAAAPTNGHAANGNGAAAH
jgi:phosphoethanolamine N-methyltransferase